MINKTIKIILVVIALIAPPLSANTHVYVIHGFGSSTIFMKSICRDLRKHNYSVTNWGYNSIGKSIPEISALLYDDIKRSKNIDSIHFVTHSMGGLVVRSLLSHVKQDSAFPRICRIVMLSPPNKGAELADFFVQSSIMKKILGPNLEFMTTDSGSLANKLPVPEDQEVGIIAGAKFDGKGYNPLIEGDNDGFLTSDKTKLGTEKDFIIIPEVHFFMTQNEKSLEYILRFLDTGRFTQE